MRPGCRSRRVSPHVRTAVSAVALVIVWLIPAIAVPAGVDVVAFVVLAVSGGVGIVLYAALWVTVPQAEVLACGLQSITNLVVRRPFAAGGPVIALNAHGDVVRVIFAHQLVNPKGARLQRRKWKLPEAPTRAGFFALRS